MNRLKLLVFVIAVLAFMQDVLAQSHYQLYAHRGGRWEQDENTLSAFKNAYENGLRGFETDIRLSADGVFVISHDASLYRMTTSKGIVEEMNAADLRKVVTKQGNPLLFLEDFLKFFADKPGAYLELEMKTTDTLAYPQKKLEKFCDDLYKVVMATKPATSTYVFITFDYRAVRYMAKKYPNADLLITQNKPCNDEMIKLAQDLGVKRLGSTLKGTSRESILKANKLGIIVSSWPVTTVAEYMLAISLGFDRVNSDNPIHIQKWAEKNYATFKNWIDIPTPNTK
jgi:glycerophosphoryl diester phosphodiesterase